MFLSVVICIYKTEQYLKKCIDSLLSQCFLNMEILLIDDGSPDEGKIIDTFKGNNIRIFHKENTGLASSRNYGLKYAKGEYVWFVDPDDEVEPGSLHVLYEILNNSRSDILRFNYRIIRDDKMEVHQSLPSEIYENGKLRQLCHFIVRNSYLLMQSCWMHVYKREVIQDIFFVNEREYAFDDVLFNLLAYQKAGKIETANEIAYRYYKREGSITGKNKCWLRQLINAYGYIREAYLEMGIYDEYRDDLINAYMDDALLGKGVGRGGALAFEYLYTRNPEDTRRNIREMFFDPTFGQLLSDSMGHRVNKQLMDYYTCLYQNDEEGLYNLYLAGSKKEKKEEQFKEETYVLKYQFIKTRVDDECVLVPVKDGNDSFSSLITLSSDGSVMFEAIEKYKDRSLILKHLFEIYPEYSHEEIRESFDDFLVKMESENILFRKRI